MGQLRPDNVSPRSNMKVWWQCQSSTDSLVEWEATVRRPCGCLGEKGAPQQTQEYAEISADAMMKEHAGMIVHKADRIEAC